MNRIQWVDTTCKCTRTSRVTIRPLARRLRHEDRRSLVGSREFNLRERLRDGYIRTFRPFRRNQLLPASRLHDSPFCVAANRFVEARVKHVKKGRNKIQGFNLYIAPRKEHRRCTPRDDILIQKDAWLRRKGAGARLAHVAFARCDFFEIVCPSSDTLLVATGNRSRNTC